MGRLYQTASGLDESTHWTAAVNAKRAAHSWTALLSQERSRSLADGYLPISVAPIFGDTA